MDLFQQVFKDASLRGIRNHIQALEGVRHPVAAPEALQQAADYVWHNLKVLGYEMAEHRFSCNGAQYKNIIATQEGSGHPDQRVVVVAHYDTVAQSPGADDNACGVAMLLELATVLKPCRFDRTLQFVAVNLEESLSPEGGVSCGAQGSRALAEHAREHRWQLEGVVVLESIAYAGESFAQHTPAGIPFEVTKVGNFLAVIGNERSRGMVTDFAEVIEKHQLQLASVSLTVPGNGETLPDCRRSDHAPFWDLGFRAIMLTDTTNFRNPHYHQSSDRLETLNLSFATEVCRATGGLLLNLAQMVP